MSHVWQNFQNNIVANPSVWGCCDVVCLSRCLL